MIDEGLKCPFCGGTVWIAVCDDEGNPHHDIYADEPWSGLSFRLVHRESEVPNDELCPIASDEPIGRYLFDDVEEAVVAWGITDKMQGIDAPPCQIGDVLWTCYKNQVIAVSVYEIKAVDRCDRELHKSRRLGVQGYYIHGVYRRPYRGHFNWNSIGKSIFYTKEEAEVKVKK